MSSQGLRFLLQGSGVVPPRGRPRPLPLAAGAGGSAPAPIVRARTASDSQSCRTSFQSGFCVTCSLSQLSSGSNSSSGNDSTCRGWPAVHQHQVVRASSRPVVSSGRQVVRSSSHHAATARRHALVGRWRHSVDRRLQGCCGGRRAAGEVCHQLRGQADDVQRDVIREKQHRRFECYRQILVPTIELDAARGCLEQEMAMTVEVSRCWIRQVHRHVYHQLSGIQARWLVLAGWLH